MPLRAISPRESLPGTKVEVEDGDRRYTLFIPASAAPSKDVVLTIHFHSAVWHAIQEHFDRGLAGPLIAIHAGEGSSVYGEKMKDPARLERWMGRTLSELRARGWPAEAEIAALDVSSFSAGYGAVRQLVQQERAFKLLRRVVLADSMYGSLLAGADKRTPLPEHVLVWKPLAEAAIRGKKTFVATFSEVPTPTYASSSEMAAALVAAVGGSLERAKEELDATKEAQFPLKVRFDKGRFHVWGYGGQDGQAHMTHARHLADVWRTLDRAGCP